jgi:hypothetical protein
VTAGAAGAAGERRLPAIRERPLAAAIYLGFVALVGLAWAAPLAAVIGGVTGAYPRGDAEILDPGGVMLVEGLRRVGQQLGAIAAAWSIVAVIAVPLGLVVMAFALAQLARPGRARPVWALARALRSFPGLAVVGLVALLAEGVGLVGVMLGGGAIARSVWPVPPARDLGRLGVLGLALGVVAAVGVVHDLARAAAVSRPLGAYGALRAAFQTVRRSAGRAAWAYAWRASLGLLAIASAGWLGVRIGHGGTGAVIASAFVHQLGLGLAGWLRLAWLAQAVRLVQPPKQVSPAGPAGNENQPLA